MSIDANDLARLREVAEAATPGPWFATANDRIKSETVTWPEGDPKDIAGCAWNIGAVIEAGRAIDAEHIATFDPPTVLALLDLAAINDENPLGEMLRADELQRQRDRALAERDTHRAQVARVEELCAQVELHDLESLNTYGQHLTGAQVVVAERIRAALEEPRA